MDNVMSITQVASRYGVSTETVRRWLISGKLKGFRAGARGKWRILRESIEHFERGTHE